MTSWFTDPPLNPNFFVNVQDHEIGPLSAGIHTLKVTTDSGGTISESNEDDNEFTKTITILDDDLNDQLSGALELGRVDHTITMPGGIDAPTDVDMFSFVVAVGQRVSFDIDQTSGLDSYILLFDTNGAELAASDDMAGPGESSGSDSYMEHTFTNEGTFYVGISGFSNTNYNAISGTGDASGSSGSYRLVVSPGLAGTIRRPLDTNAYLVDIFSYGVEPPAINTNQRTWIVIHGWNSYRTKDNIFALASALYETRFDDQVLTLDWRSAADTNLDPSPAEDSIVPVAQWAADALIRYGISGTNLNLVGHSFGSYVANEIAERIPGGVNTIVTLDPAANIFGGYDPTANDEVNFALHSFFSWSFHSSSVAGNEFTPTTADESFVVNSDALFPWDAHGNVVFMFAYMLLHPTDLVSQYFLLTALLEGTFGPWLPDQFFSLNNTVRGYEAVIDTTDDGKVPSALTFVRFPSLSISIVDGGIAIGWPAYYANFVLQTSTISSQPAMWSDVSLQPERIGEWNVVVFPWSESGRFFRLKRL